MRNFIFFLLSFFAFSTVGISQTKDRLPCIDKTFSIVVHIVKDSLKDPGIAEATITASIPALNTAFSPICVSFAICEFKYIDNFAYNNLRTDKDWPEVQNQYNLKNRINIYYVASIKDVFGCVYGDPEGITELTKFGILIGKSCASDPKAIAQAMGSYFGLKRTFDTTNGAELANGSNCKTAGDQICDTPADPFVLGDNAANYVDGNCKFISMKKDAKGQYYDPLVGNTMSGYPCSCGFTDEQYIKMATVYLSKTGMW